MLKALIESPVYVLAASHQLADEAARRVGRGQDAEEAVRVAAG